MKRVKPHDLTGPRSYITAFDPEIISRTSDIEALKIEVQRKLKLLLLIKSNVVCPASHLTSDLAFSIFAHDPDLLHNGIVLPALRSDKESIAEVFEEKGRKTKQGVTEFFEENIVATVSWDLADNSSWFRERFLDGLVNERSVIRTHITKASESLIDHLVKQIEADSLLNRESTTEAILRFDPREQEVLLTYRELLYHLSGARVVNCESALPQEDYIDFDLADMQGNRTRLSEVQILWKLFVELAMDSVQCHTLPIELLDALSLRDILQIRQPLLNSDFQEKYDSLVMKAVSAVPRDETGLLVSAAHLEELHSSIVMTFKAVFDEELPHYLKKRALIQSKSLGDVSSSVALDALSFVPVIGLVASTMSLLKDSRAFFVNVGNQYTTKKAIRDATTYNNARSQYIVKTLSKVKLSDKSQMLDMVSMLTDILTERMKM